jgi:DNA-binding CsgD family transcriptional regulator
VLRLGEQSIADRSNREELTSLRVGFACAAGRPLDALDAAAPILERRGSSRRAVLRTLLHVVPGFAIVGRTERALDAADQALAAARGLGEELPFAPGHLVIGRLLALRLSGELAKAERIGTNGYKHALELGDQDSMALVAMFLGQVALDQGRATSAARWLREAQGCFREIDVMGFLPWCQADLARAYALAGDVAQADIALAEAREARSEVVRIDRAALGTAAVWVAAAKGELSKALRLARSTAETADARGQAAFAAIALHDLARLGEPRWGLPKLQAIAAASQGRVFPLYADHASALAEGRGEELEVIARRFEELGALLLAAESLSEAAATYRAAGRAASARSAELRARALVERCEGTGTVWAVPSADELTPREREVAALAAAGLSNRAIAKCLVLSTRTVENHLQHVYGKLGATSRVELPALLELGTAE